LKKLALLALAACGPQVRTTAPTRSQAESEAQQLAAGGVSAIRAALHDSVDFGGMWFPDDECRQEFMVPRHIPAAELDAFARCVARTHLVVDRRGSEMPDFALFTYDPGIEVEARLIPGASGAQIVWIGYVGSAEGHAQLPSVTPGALEDLRTAGDPQAAQVGEDDLAWFKVCVDRDGKVTGAHAMKATTQAAEDAWRANIASWQFKPFVLGGEASPVCSWFELAAPYAERDHAIPVPPLEPELAVRVPRKLVSGTTGIVPTEPRAVIGTLRFCIGADGTVTKAGMYTSTGLPDYDRAVVDGARSWNYEPGPAETCDIVVVAYRPR